MSENSSRTNHVRTQKLETYERLCLWRNCTLTSLPVHDVEKFKRFGFVPWSVSYTDK